MYRVGGCFDVIPNMLLLSLTLSLSVKSIILIRQSIVFGADGQAGQELAEAVTKKDKRPLLDSFPGKLFMSG